MSAAATGEIEIAGAVVEILDLPGVKSLPPLVLLHEGLGSIALWRGFPAALHRATGRRLIAFSRHGHGRSAPPPRPRTPAFFHEEALEVLPELLAALGARRPVLVGHSDGASIALIHAASEDVTALVLLAPHVFVEELTLAQIREARRAYVDGDLRARLGRHHDDPDAAFSGWCDVWLDPAFGAWTLAEEAQRLTAPTLLIQGAEDPYGSVAQLEGIETRARGPVQRLLLAGGHSPQLEHESAVVDAIALFVAACQSSSRSL